MSDKIPQLNLELERLQRVLESWQSGSVNELERDIVLAKLRYLYEQVKFLSPQATPTTAVESVPLTVEIPAPEVVQEPIVPEKQEPKEQPEEHQEIEVQEEHDRQKMRRNALRSLYDSGSVGGMSHEKEVHIPEDIFDERSSVETTTKQEDEKGLHKLIEINDRFLIVREVFGGDHAAYEQAIDELEKYTDLDEAFLHIHEQYRWNPNSEGVKLLIDLLTRKFS